MSERDNYRRLWGDTRPLFGGQYQKDRPMTDKPTPPPLSGGEEEMSPAVTKAMARFDDALAKRRQREGEEAVREAAGNAFSSYLERQTDPTLTSGEVAIEVAAFLAALSPPPQDGGSGEGSSSPAEAARPVPERVLSRLGVLASRMQFRVDAIVEREGSVEKAVTSHGVGIGYLLAKNIADACRAAADVLEQEGPLAGLGVAHRAERTPNPSEGEREALRRIRDRVKHTAPALTTAAGRSMMADVLHIVDTALSASGQGGETT